MNKYKTYGWKNESERHSLARRGILTAKAKDKPFIWKTKITPMSTRIYLHPENAVSAIIKNMNREEKVDYLTNRDLEEHNFEAGRSGYHNKIEDEWTDEQLDNAIKKDLLQNQERLSKMGKHFIYSKGKKKKNIDDGYEPDVYGKPTTFERDSYPDSELDAKGKKKVDHLDVTDFYLSGDLDKRSAISMLKAERSELRYDIKTDGKSDLGGKPYDNFLTKEIKFLERRKRK